MASQVSTAEADLAYEVAGVAIPPSLDDYQPLQSVQYLIHGGAQSTGVQAIPKPKSAGPTLPVHARVRLPVWLPYQYPSLADKSPFALPSAQTADDDNHGHSKVSQS